MPARWRRDRRSARVTVVITAPRTTYERFHGFEQVYLEDGWVLRVEADRSSLAIDLEVVLTEEHPSYAPPERGEQYCYRRGVIRFAVARDVDWRRVTMHPATDASGEPDFGNVDYLYEEDGRYFLGGDWGDVAVLSGEPPSLELI